jgi:hypothetical protein
MKKEFRTDMEQECNHQWEVDNGSGYNTVDMSINEKQAKWDIKVKAGEAKHRRLLGNTDLRMECRICETAIWVVQYAVCKNNRGNPLLCDDCDEIEGECICVYCEECDEASDDCVCKEEEE